MDSLINPTDVSSITKILAHYELMRSLGNAGEKWLTTDREREAMDKELMRLSIARERRMLGYEDSWDYNQDMNRSNLPALGFFELKRRTPRAGLASLIPESLQPSFKWATFVGDYPSAVSSASKEGASHAGNAILRAIAKSA